MRRAPASGLAFAVSAGEPADLDGVLHVEPPRGERPGRRRLLAVVEPMEPTPRGDEVAAAALAALREAFWAAADQPVAVALGEGFAAANAAVREENRLASGEGRGRRMGVGASAVALDGRQIVLAQVPPSQAILVQEGQIYAFPDLASWRSDYTPSGDRIAPDPEPLGWQELASPDLFCSLAAPDDVILLCASSLSACLAREAEERGEDGSRFADLLREGDPDAIAERLVEATATYEIDYAHAACCTVGRLHTLDVALIRESICRLGLAWGLVPAQSRRGERAPSRRVRRQRRPGLRPRRGALAPPTRRREAIRAAADDEPDPVLALDLVPAVADGEAASAATPTEAVARPRPRGGETGTVTGHRPLAVAEGPIGILDDAELPAEVAARPSQEPEIAPHPFGRGAPRCFDGGMYPTTHPQRAEALDALHLRAAQLGERLAPRRPQPALRAGRAVATLSPGALGLQRYRGTGTLDLPGGWRLTLPGRRLAGPARIMLAVCLAFSLVGLTAGALGSGPMAGAADAVGIAALADHVGLTGWARLPGAHQRQVATALGRVDAHLTEAAATSDPTLAAQQIELAAAALADAIAIGAGGDALATRQAALTAAQDRIAGVVRLAGPIRIATLPTAEQRTLLFHGGSLYVAGTQLLAFDADDREIDRLVAGGNWLNGTQIGEIRGAAVEEEGIRLTDGTTLFTRDAAGTWSARPLPLPAGVGSAWPAAPCGAFDGNFYLLDVDTGRILKFAGDDPTAPPADWAGEEHVEDLRTARDMVIDGRIHVLLADGRILTFMRGTLEHVYALPPEMPVVDPIALFASHDGRTLYLLDRGDGSGNERLYAIDRASDAAHELALPPIPGSETTLLATTIDIAIDAEAGLLYLLTPDALWRTTLR